MIAPKVVIPLAGLGTRMRPHTHSKAKPMVRLAGKPILGHLLDWVVTDDVDEIILIISPHQTDVEAYARSATTKPIRIVVQEQPRGQADAIARVRNRVDGPVLILFSDTLASVTFDHLASVTTDGLIYVKEIADPSRMGVVVVSGDKIVDIIEKPKHAESNLATIGMYYFRTSDRLFAAIDQVLSAPPTLNDEYFIADAIKRMIRDGAQLEPYVTQDWVDTGTPDYTLSAHRYLLDRIGGEALARRGVTIVPPVFIADSADVRESVIGPYVTVEAGCRVERAVLTDCIMDEHSVVENRVLSRSILGRRARLIGEPLAANIGDDAALAPPSGQELPTL